MEYSESSYAVATDYRMKIIVDWDSPILAFKANRERYTNPHQYAGSPRLSSSHSEDAITWNVFRSLQKTGKLDIITSKVGIGEPRGLLLWAVAPEPDGESAMLQYVTGSVMRKIDGIFPGQINAPDVVLLGTTGVVVVVVCKQSEQAEAQHQWEGELDRVKHLRMCLREYEEVHPVIPKEDAPDEEREAAVPEKYPGIIQDGTSDEALTPVWRLVSMALLAKELGVCFKVEPAVVTIASTRQWSEKFTETGKSASDLWKMFGGMLGKDAPRCDLIFWQHLPGLIDTIRLADLKTNLLTRPLLYDVDPSA